MVHSRLHFYVRFLSVAIVVSNLLLSAPDMAEAEDVRCPESHPFAYNGGRSCCEVQKGKDFDNKIVEWTNRKLAWDASNCEGTSEPCKTTYPEYTGPNIPCENFHEPAECDPDMHFTCEVSRMCLDKHMTCNGVYDCRNWYDFHWDDDSDESTASALCEWCNEGDPCSVAGETCQHMGYKEVRVCKEPYGICKA